MDAGGPARNGGGKTYKFNEPGLSKTKTRIMIETARADQMATPPVLPHQESSDNAAVRELSDSNQGNKHSHGSSTPNLGISFDWSSPVLSTQFPKSFDPRPFLLTGGEAQLQMNMPRKPKRLELNSVLGSIVKVFTVSTSANWILPWQTKQQYEKIGSGFIVEGQRIITNAHCVADQSYVMVRKHGNPTKFLAKVLAVGHECDLAILTTVDAEFWDGTEALQFGDVPELQDPVAVVGYPLGGDNLSVSVGVVSRVEPQQFTHGATCLLAIQIDAAINPGNSGGPAMMDNKVVGVAFQGLKVAENIGFIIPTSVVQHFLHDVERNDGKYIGFPVLGATYQPLENPQLRAFFGMASGDSGVLITKLRAMSDAAKKLDVHDILLEVDNQAVGNDGSVVFRGKERILFEYLVWQRYVGDEMPVTILRDGTRMKFNIKVDIIRHGVPVQLYDKMPRYLIYSGLVFVPLVQPYLREYGEDWYNKCPRNLCDKAFNWEAGEAGEEIVVLSQVLQDSSNRGFETLCNLQVLTCNDCKIRNLAHLTEVMDNKKSGFQKLVMEGDRLIILDTKLAERCNAAILQRHRIPSDRFLSM